MARKLPFTLQKDQSFFESLSDWIGDTLYDELPEKGFDLRDEQVFMAFQIEQALKDKKVLFAEAGVGTGKTIAYLLPAISYARYTGRPALISCADETLIDQLVKEDGDIQKMSDALQLNIDVRLAKSRDQYLCLKRLEYASDVEGEEFADAIEEELPSFVYGMDSLQKVYPYGERSSFPELSDDQWQKINYNQVQQCGSCDVRNVCGQTLHRQAYRESTDLIICSHDFYMEHVWTKESRKRQELLPLLPELSMIVFDEGHLLEYSAQRALTYEVQSETLIRLLEKIMVEGVREVTLEKMDELIELHALFFDELEDYVTPTDGDRFHLEKAPHLKKIAKKCIALSHSILEELVFDGEMYVIPAYDLRMVEEYLEQYIFSMTLFTEDEEAVDWVEEREGDWTIVIMPRLVTDILREQLFNQQLPIIFSSATLSVEKDFSYIQYSLGISEALKFSVESPFDYDEVMEIKEYVTADKKEQVLSIMRNYEQTLVLFKSKQSMLSFKEQLTESEKELFAFEGDRELSAIVEDFSLGIDQAIASYNLWEGLDLPEHRLTQVILYDLPLPPNDPLFEARKAHAEDPFDEVELPFMQLRLRQGVGRLIRTTKDHGVVHLLVDESEYAYRAYYQDLFPVRIQEV